MDASQQPCGPAESGAGSSEHPVEDPSLKRWERQPEHVKEKILEKYRDWNVALGYDWFDSVYECFIEKMKERGIDVENNEIFFSGFWSQGDGASFVGHLSSWELFIRTHELEKHYPKFCEAWKLYSTGTSTLEIAATFSTGCRGSYAHSGTMFSSWDYDLINDTDEDNVLTHAAVEQIIDEALGEIGTLENHLLEIFRGHADDLYNDLKSEYEYLTSDEAVLEALHANDELDKALNDYYEENDDEDEPVEEAAEDVLPS